MNAQSAVDKDLYQADWVAMEHLWPDGTWTLPWGDSRSAQMDDVTRSMLLECWEAQDRQAAGEGPAPRNPVPEAWRPSEAVLKQRLDETGADSGFVQHVLARLQTLGQLAP